jgi:hypothetical protein
MIADSQVKLEFIVRELGSMIFANFPSIRVGLPDGRGSLFLDFDCPFSGIQGVRRIVCRRSPILTT